MSRLKELETIPDPAERAQACVGEMQKVEDYLEELRFLRNHAFAQLHSQGVSVRKIADRYGVSKTLVAQITG